MGVKAVKMRQNNYIGSFDITCLAISVIQCLIEEMMGNLPIPVYPTSALAKHLSENGIKIDAFAIEEDIYKILLWL